ncbi:MAG: endonuclease [Bacteroidetes bacterium CG12_big_fil_rev_8_21_14_0_65_60_17]|nr:MAG: endonuclease [Bacteroidetes bacterium CG12_big_fil_rev_8_21_14_0_65_60_17]
MIRLVLSLFVLLATGCAPDPDPDTVRVLAYNIHHGEGMDEALDLERIAAIIRDVDPDFVALQEIDSVVTRTGGVDQAAVLGELTGMTPFFGGFMPYQGGTYGMALLSAWPTRDVTNFRLPNGEEPRSALSLVATSPSSGRQLRIVGIHFYMTQEERLAQAVSLNDHLATDSLPTVLAGDFNSEPGGVVMEYLAENWHIVPKGDDNLTFSSYDPFKEIDFMLLRPRDRFRVVRQYLLDEPVASDHRPLVMDIVLE